MDLEELNKTQIILLTLLTSFVTSIATGIVTVSLVNQAPQGVTQTINRIVERTVEKVVPTTSSSQTNLPVKETTIEKTVVVKENDLAPESIAKTQNKIVRIVEKGAPESSFYARGIVIDTTGTVLTDGMVDGALGSEVILPDGVRVPFTVRKGFASAPVSVLDLDLRLATTTKLVSATLADSTKLRLGESVIRIGGKGRDAVGVGVISALASPGATDRTGFLEASVVSTTPGSVLINVFGDVIGMTTRASLSVGSELYTPSSELLSLLVPEKAE